MYFKEEWKGEEVVFVIIPATPQLNELATELYMSVSEIIEYKE